MKKRNKKEEKEKRMGEGRRGRKKRQGIEDRGRGKT